ncbi:MAG TPA: hypothetical protein VFC78_02780 [Tepidisphaeraceae bacterium]|nr:hypothetical protein [Tepidisphaeraceae bacterium]
MTVTYGTWAEFVRELPDESLALHAKYATGPGPAARLELERRRQTSNPQEKRSLK